jgi:hypothetical protein
MEASTRGDVKIVEACENIRCLSQKIAKEYLYLYNNPKKINLQTTLTASMKELEKNIYVIAINTQSDDSKDILSFLSYSNEEIKLLLNQKATKDKSLLILDYSETFIEASNSIQFLHQYEFSEEEKMLTHLKEFEYLLERVLKYYIASIMNLNRISNQHQMHKTIMEIEKTLDFIKQYSYPEKIKKEQKNIINSWKINKKFLNNSAELFIPNLLSISIQNVKDTINRLELYHTKNQ